MMKLYRLNGEVLAEQWFPGVEIDGVTELFNPGPIPVGIATIENQGIGVLPGHWVIKEQDGRLASMAPEDFHTKYTPSDIDAPPEGEKA